jgi:hypothetical protein
MFLLSSAPPGALARIPGVDLPDSPRTSESAVGFFIESGHVEELVDGCPCRVRQMTAEA